MTQPKLRCAIYTRKSSEEGLEQSFNSLHAQREACEAFVQSQKSEGWTAIRTAYDDGGFSGGNMDRPALKALLAEVEAGRVDVVVVYKVDRLTRSLMDFAKIVEAFDKRGVSFVSVTQSFNTTSSMGRLTLNVLLSFAQFEREVTGERIRDKIAASKAKGIWMGGTPALGYDFADRKLIVNEAEALIVRRLFTRYLELGTVNALKAELDRDGVVSKAWTTRSGKLLGGCSFSRGALFHMLKNRLFIGEIVHKEKSYPGLHQPIVGRELFDAVEAHLAANGVSRAEAQNRNHNAPLKGLVFDHAGELMSPCHAQGKSGRRFRYYVSASVQRGHAPPADEAVRRVSAPQLEALVEERLMRLGLEGALAASVAEVARVEIHSYCLRIRVRTGRIAGGYPDVKAAVAGLTQKLEPYDRLEPSDDGTALLTIGVRPVFRGGRTWLANPAGRTNDGQPKRDRRLIEGLKQAHAMLRAHNASPLATTDQQHLAASPDSSYGRRLMRLALLAPDIQRAILDGRQPAGLTFRQFMDHGAPPAWEDQRAVFGFPA